MSTDWFDNMSYKIATGLFVILSEWNIKEAFKIMENVKLGVQSFGIIIFIVCVQKYNF